MRVNLDISNCAFQVRRYDDPEQTHDLERLPHGLDINYLDHGQPGTGRAGAAKQKDPKSSDRPNRSDSGKMQAGAWGPAESI